MKSYFFIILISLTCLIGCMIDKNPILSSSESEYFPLNVGNTWYYDSPTPQTNPWAMKTIKANFMHNNAAYYSWTYGEGVDIIDNIRADDQGNIWKLHNDHEILWFDFTMDSGSTYIFDYSETFGENVYHYRVNVSKNLRAETPAGVFENCIMFLFDIPEVKDEERAYVFAPRVGPVILSHGWTSKSLTSANINNSTIGN